MTTRARKVNVATVRLWEQDVGAVAWNEERGISEFEYEAAFMRLGLDIAPLMMPLRNGVFSFPGLNRDTFHGLPGLLAAPGRRGRSAIRTACRHRKNPAPGYHEIRRI